MGNENAGVRVATPDEPLPHTALLEQALSAMAEVQERAEPGFAPDVAVIPAEDWRTFIDAHAEILLLWTAWRYSPYRDEPSPITYDAKGNRVVPPNATEKGTGGG